MTESEWLVSEDLAAMLDHLKWVNGTGYSRIKKPSLLPSDRKLRLFACACRPLAPDAAEVGSHSWKSWKYVEDNPNGPFPESAFATRPLDLAQAACDWCKGPNRMKAAAFLREIVGNPWRLVTLPKERMLVPVGPWEIDAGTIDRGWGDEYCPWLTPEVLSLAEAAYEERLIQPVWGQENYQGGAGGRETRQREVIVGHMSDGVLDPFRLMLVAEALEDAGCVGEEVPCLRNCWELYGVRVYSADGRRHSTAPATRCDCRNGKVRLPSPLLEHLRGAGPHVRGCFALDMILGRN